MSSPRSVRSTRRTGVTPPARRLALPLVSAVIVALAIMGIPTSAWADASPPGNEVLPAADPVPPDAPTASSEASTTPLEAPTASPEGSTDPSTDPLEAPTAPPTPQPTPTSESTPASEPEPEPTPTPTPTAQDPGATATATEAAQLTAAQRATAQRATAAAYAAAARHASAVLSAEARLGTAHTALGRANLLYSSVQADYDRAVSRVDLVRAMRHQASLAADASRRALALCVRSLRMRSGAEELNALSAGNPGNDIVFRFSTLDTLSRLTANLDEMRARVVTDAARESALSAQETAAQSVLTQVPIAEARAARAAAQRAQDDATAALTALTGSAPDTFATDAPDLNPLGAGSSVADTGQLTNQGWARPAVGRITDQFGPRPVHPVTGVGDFHRGTDIGSDCDSAIYAATDGTVEAVGVLGTYGNWILIGHGSGIETGYAHIADGEILVTVGEHVNAGQVIAGVGATGAATGCHLHFEVRINGTAVNAVPFLAHRGVSLGR